MASSKFAFYSSRLHVAIDQGKAAGFVVSRDDDQRVSIFLGKVQGGANAFVEIDHFVDDVLSVIGVSAPVDLRAFDHQEKAFFILIEEAQGRLGACQELVATAFSYFFGLVVGGKGS